MVADGAIQRLRVEHIDRERRGVVVAADHQRLLELEQFGGVRAQAVEERELEREALGADRGAVRHVHRGDAHAIDHRLDVARLVVALVARQALAHVLERPLGQDRDAVAPARLAAHRDIVAAVLERLRGKLLGVTLVSWSSAISGRA